MTPSSPGAFSLHILHLSLFFYLVTVGISMTPISAPLWDWISAFHRSPSSLCNHFYYYILQRVSSPFSFLVARICLSRFMSLLLIIWEYIYVMRETITSFICNFYIHFSRLCSFPYFEEIFLSSVLSGWLCFLRNFCVYFPKTAFKYCPFLLPTPNSASSQI